MSQREVYGWTNGGNGKIVGRTLSSETGAEENAQCPDPRVIFQV